MKRCPSCFLDNQADAVFCVRCGFSLVAVADGSNEGAHSRVASRYLATGSLVDGKYRIEKVLGEGGMGVVYLAHDVHTDMHVVVKSIRVEFADNPEFRARTLAEGRALARIDHPNVVHLNAVVVESTGLYLVMQYIEGEPLDKMIERHVGSRTAMPISLILSIFRMVLQGVGAAHAEGLIHRDLKPANILVRKKDGVAKVTDFGIAKVEEDAKAGRGVTKGIIGSLSYMAPEQVRGQRDLDKRVDIYALGIVLFELVMGRAPFDAPSDYELMRMQAESPLPSVVAQRPDAPAYLDDILSRACAKDRERRFASTEEFLAALDEAESRGHGSVPVVRRGHVATEIAPPPPTSVVIPTVSPPPSLPFRPPDTSEGASLPPGPRPSPRRRGAWMPYAGAAVVTLGGLAAFYALSSDSSTTGSGTTGTRPVLEGGATTVHAALDAGTQHETTAAPSPLARLAGAWRSASGRDFTAVLADDDSLEFRVRDAAQHARQGYEDGDVRFKLTIVPGSKDDFAVEDRLRPTPPPGLEYDPKTSRESCIGVFTAVKGRKLLAQLDGTSTLTVDLVQVRTSADKFKTQGKRVIGCAGVASAPAEAIESKLLRVP